MRSIRQGAALAAVTVISAMVTPVAATAASGPCEAPLRGSSTYDDFVLTYKSACATKKNYDRTFQDVTASVLVDKRNRLSVTTSTALAGAIASVKVNDKEFISSGGHGAAFQYAFHAWQRGEAATECYNPTQAGTRLDDVGQPPPYHGPSTSALYTMARVRQREVSPSPRGPSRATRRVSRQAEYATGAGRAARPCHATCTSSSLARSACAVYP